ncbi:sporulation protein YqfC [Virgibacillus profundi]|uniref:Sporulation protein YqfC n=1 Tax=Virgibacillus profundi TaxID=2024555 RepID=A0A2A2IBN4_9BACI|nr:sporulation protein YqfC [Virgibacillus profundi]PAV29027.1 sporulation protein YqfC [Virgibacillus profundi]PXY53196.1 sporulation protein YqfC [Virgibacillus profundi]
MRKFHQRFKPWLIKYLALPSDVILELPRITIIGQLHVYIENHQGLEKYSDSELKLKTNKGYIEIIGSSFVLKMMLPEEILLEGTIQEVKFTPDQ